MESLAHIHVAGPHVCLSNQVIILVGHSRPVLSCAVICSVHLIYSYRTVYLYQNYKGDYGTCSKIPLITLYSISSEAI